MDDAFRLDVGEPAGDDAQVLHAPLQGVLGEAALHGEPLPGELHSDRHRIGAHRDEEDLEARLLEALRVADLHRDQVAVVGAELRLVLRRPAQHLQREAVRVLTVLWLGVRLPHRQVDRGEPALGDGLGDLVVLQDVLLRHAPHLLEEVHLRVRQRLPQRRRRPCHRRAGRRPRAVLRPGGGPSIHSPWGTRCETCQDLDPLSKRKSGHTGCELCGLGRRLRQPAALLPNPRDARARQEDGEKPNRGNPRHREGRTSRG
mmetsp:Transcript_24592/g.70181  ORF Transcript_24592/g.70181 Transcript_24592/m.70181 type:complete len:259 (+) Transcript_24592:625-1401(+)